MGTVPSHPAPVLLAGPVTLPAQRHHRPLHFGGTRSLFPGGCTATRGTAIPSQLVGTFCHVPSPWAALLADLLVVCGETPSKDSQMFPQIVLNFRKGGMKSLKNTHCCNMECWKRSFPFDNKSQLPLFYFKRNPKARHDLNYCILPELM